MAEQMKSDKNISRNFFIDTRQAKALQTGCEKGCSAALFATVWPELIAFHRVNGDSFAAFSNIEFPYPALDSCPPHRLNGDPSRRRVFWLLLLWNSGHSGRVVININWPLSENQ